MKIKNIISIMFVSIVLFTLVACSNTTSTTTVLPEVTEEQIVEMTETVSVIDGLYIGLLDNATITNSTNIEMKNNTITIKSGGTYTITGILNDGQVVVDTNEAVVINLDSVSITNIDGAAIYIEDADGSTTINLVEGTSNTLTDGSTHSDEEITAVLYSKDDLILQGSGTLTVNANYNDGIVSKDSLIINNGVYIITSQGDAIYGKDSLVINDGEFTILTGEGSAAAPVQEDTMSQGGKPGSSNIFSTEDEVDEGSFKGLKTEGLLTINDGTFTIDSYDDAIHSNNEIEIYDGTFTIKSGDDAIHATTLLTIYNGDITISFSAEGLESFSVIINGGDLSITAYDDGINATNGTNSSVGGAADHPEYGAYDLETDPHIIINGGSVLVNSGGDGIDANGVVIINGGETIVNGKGTSTGMIESPIDFDITGIVNGGTVIATGTSTMAYQFDSVKSTQNSLVVTFNGYYNSNTLIEILDSNQNTLGTMTTSDSFETLIFSSEELVKGETYTLIIGSDAYTITLSSSSSVSIFS